MLASEYSKSQLATYAHKTLLLYQNLDYRIIFSLGTKKALHPCGGHDFSIFR